MEFTIKGSYNKKVSLFFSGTEMEVQKIKVTNKS